MWQPCSGQLYSVALAMSGFWAHLFIHGIIYTPGVFYVIFLRELQYDHPSQVAFGTSLHSAVLYGSGPVCSVLINSYGCRFVGVLGGAISGAGLVITALNKSVYHMTIMFGVVTGLGMGMCYMANIVMISRHFTKYRPVAFAIANSAIGFGTIVYPPLLSALDAVYGWKGALLIVGGISLNLVVCAAMYREPANSESRLSKNRQNIRPTPPKEESQERSQDDVTRKRMGRTIDDWKKTFSDIKIFYNRDYMTLCASLVFICIGLSVLYVHLAAFTETRGIDTTKSAMLFSLIGLGNFCGQLIIGGLHQLPQCTGFITLTIGFATVGTMMLLVTLVTKYVFFLVIAMVIGTGCGCFGISVLDIIVRLLGVDMVSAGFGYALFFMAIGQAIGAPLAGIIYDVTGRYTSSMCFGGALLIAGPLLMLPALIKSCRPLKDPSCEIQLGVAKTDAETEKI